MNQTQKESLTRCLSLLEELDLENEFALGTYGRIAVRDMRATLRQVLSIEETKER